MLRLRSQVLSEIDGCCYYNQELFTGVALDVVGCAVKRKTEYSKGTVVGAYENSNHPIGVHKMEVDFSCLMQEEDGVDEPYLYENKRFSGKAYEFYNDCCISEFVFDNGWVIGESSFLPSGELVELEISEDDLSQTYSWNGNGDVIQFDMFKEKSFGISLVFEEGGGITTLSIDGDYFNKVSRLSDKIKYKLFDDKSFPLGLVASNYFYLSGSAVDDDVFSNLLANNGLGITSKLRICRSSLTATSIVKLISYTNVDKLYVESEIIGLEDMKDFKTQRSECYVEFNRKEVVV